MAMNVFIIKRLASLTLMGFIPTFAFYSISTFVSFWWGIAALIISVIITMQISSFMMSNPFTKLVEGQGILAFNLDSTGIFNPFIVKVKSPYIVGSYNGKQIKDVWNRKSVFYIANPFKNKNPAILDEEGGISLKLDNKGLNKSRFALFHYPVLIYNAQIQSFITKDVLSEKENSLFAEHSILFLNRQEEELTSQIRNFGRSVVDLLKPSGDILKNPWVWIVVVIAAVILIAMFAPQIIATINGSAGQAISRTIQNTGQTMSQTTQTITPIG